jgi:hypothetical protein
MAEKVQQKNHGKKIVARKSAAEKSRQKKCGKKIVATTWLGSIYENLWQQIFKLTEVSSNNLI